AQLELRVMPAHGRVAQLHARLDRAPDRCAVLHLERPSELGSGEDVDPRHRPFALPRPRYAGSRSLSARSTLRATSSAVQRPLNAARPAISSTGTERSYFATRVGSVSMSTSRSVHVRPRRARSISAFIASQRWHPSRVYSTSSSGSPGLPNMLRGTSLSKGSAASETSLRPSRAP